MASMLSFSSFNNQGKLNIKVEFLCGIVDNTGYPIHDRNMYRISAVHIFHFRIEITIALLILYYVI